MSLCSIVISRPILSELACIIARELINWTGEIVYVDFDETTQYEIYYDTIGLGAEGVRHLVATGFIPPELAVCLYSPVKCDEHGYQRFPKEEKALVHARHALRHQAREFFETEWSSDDLADWVYDPEPQARGGAVGARSATEIVRQLSYTLKEARAAHAYIETLDIPRRSKAAYRAHITRRTVPG